MAKKLSKLKKKKKKHETHLDLVAKTDIYRLFS